MKSLMLVCMMLIASTSMARNYPVTTQATTENYYEQFMFGVTGDCQSPSSVWFLTAFNWDDVVLGQDDKGRPVHAHMTIQLFPEGGYWTRYTEMALIKQEGDKRSFDVIIDRAVEGKWNVSANKLVVDGLGEAVPVKMGASKNVDGFRFQFTKALNDPRVLKVTFDVSKGMSNTGPRGVSIKEYCGIK